MDMHSRFKSFALGRGKRCAVVDSTLSAWLPSIVSQVTDAFEYPEARFFYFYLKPRLLLFTILV
jgi:hypothetical protein